jgi:hypothetical protein
MFKPQFSDLQNGENGVMTQMLQAHAQSPAMCKTLGLSLPETLQCP